ncbi:MAG: LPS export ABC transporter periplasmic protein LptC [Alphaproteobacteria bacterium]
MSNVIDAGERGWTASRRTDVDRAVRAAGRHSIMVRMMRIGLPIAVIGGLGALAAVTYYTPTQVFEKVPMSGKLAVQGSKITMELPRIVGFTRDNRAYELNAETAVQDISSPDIIELQNLRARLEMQDKDVVNVTANSGTYNTKGDKVVLRDQVVVTSQNGYKAVLKEAAIEMKKGNVVSEQPVDITLPTGWLKSNRMEIVDSGDLVRFDRGVTLYIEAQKGDASQ